MMRAVIMETLYVWQCKIYANSESSNMLGTWAPNSTDGHNYFWATVCTRAQQ